MAKDILGGFHIPSHLMEKAKAYTPPVKPTVKQTPPAINIKFTSDKPLYALPFGTDRIIEKIKSSSSASIHTVSGHIDNVSGKAVIKCTCQGFRIQKKGYCKHTKAMNAKYDFGV